jgi:protein O-GlcNAc transferase
VENHPCAFMLASVLRGHDRRRVQPVVIDARRTPSRDDMARALRAVPRVEWAPTPLPEDDGAAAAAVAALRLDVLVEMMGITEGHRLGVVRALRAATASSPRRPVIASWFAFPGSTGLAGVVDVKLADAVAVPPDAEPLFVERVVRLPRGFHCYTPMVATPAGKAPPRDYAAPPGPRRRVVFACFNNPAKVTPAALAAWVRILDAVPAAVLRLLYPSYGSDAYLRSLVAGRFAAAGGDPARLEIGALPPAAALAAYRDADVALDPWPYNGGTITCDALYMATPPRGRRTRRPRA